MPISLSSLQSVLLLLSYYLLSLTTLPLSWAYVDIALMTWQGWNSTPYRSATWRVIWTQSAARVSSSVRRSDSTASRATRQRPPRRRRTRSRRILSPSSDSYRPPVTPRPTLKCSIWGPTAVMHRWHLLQVNSFRLMKRYWDEIRNSNLKRIEKKRKQHKRKQKASRLFVCLLTELICLFAYQLLSIYLFWVFSFSIF